MPDLATYGVFHEEGVLAVADPYKHPKPAHTLPDRWKGKQLLTVGPPHKGKGRDTLLDKKLLMSIAGDEYVEQHAIAKALAGRSGKGLSTAWRPNNPTPKMGRASGSLYGTFGPANCLMDTDASIGANSGRLKASSADHKRSIYVNRLQSGTYGFPDQSRLIGAAKFPYYQEEYCRGRSIEKEMRRVARERLSKPFMGTLKRDTCFASDAEIFGRPPEPCTPSGRKDRSSSAGRPTWRPSHPPAKGHGEYGALNKIPYIPNPPLEEGRHASEKVFRPNGQPHPRLSMWSPNPYRYQARQPPDIDFTLIP